MTIKINSIEFNNEQNCATDSEWNRPRILSKEATQEIMGDRLCSLIAIGVDGKPVYYLPYGTDISTTGDHTESQVGILLNFLVKIPVQEPPFQTKTYTLCQPAGGGRPRPCPC